MDAIFCSTDHSELFAWNKSETPADTSLLLVLTFFPVGFHTTLILNMFSGFGWDGVNFLHSCLYGAVLQTGDHNNAGNTAVF